MRGKSLVTAKNLPTLVTIGLFMAMFGAGSIVFESFFAVQNFFNLFIDNAYLLILAVGMTFVIVSGGIDLSVGSMLALSTMVTSGLLEKAHVNPFLVIGIVLTMGTVLGLFMGFLIQTFEIPPFIVTLAGLYLGRGLCYVVSIDTIPITNEFFNAAALSRITIIRENSFLSRIPIIGGFFIGENSISPSVIIALVIVLAGLYVLRFTKFGRTVYAIGGSEQSSILMGLPVARTKISIYALSGFCAALAGIVFTFYTLSGYALNGKSMELDSIASVVIGGALLTGGVGGIMGTVFGVLVFGTIQILIMFQGTLNSWWTRIAIGFLVFLFCLLQRLFEARKGARAQIVQAAK
jgi:ribose/xylose/arabinose/galactoside ABC-type transport system permease subunit